MRKYFNLWANVHFDTCSHHKSHRIPKHFYCPNSDSPASINQRVIFQLKVPRLPAPALWNCNLLMMNVSLTQIFYQLLKQLSFSKLGTTNFLCKMEGRFIILKYDKWDWWETINFNETELSITWKLMSTRELKLKSLNLINHKFNTLLSVESHDELVKL